MTNKHGKRFLTLLIIREMKKLQCGITSHQSEWPSSKNIQTVNAAEVGEKKEPSCTIGGNVN